MLFRSIAEEAIASEYVDSIVKASAEVINNVVGGRLNGLGYRDMKPIVELATAVEGLVASIIKDENNEVVEVIFNELRTLYAKATIASFASASANLSINAVITSVANVVVVVVPGEELDEIIQVVAELINVLVHGTVSNPIFNDAQSITSLANAIKALLDGFVSGEIVDAVFVELNELYADRKSVV